MPNMTPTLTPGPSTVARNQPNTSRPARAGFTLFEVSISLVLVAFGVISVLMLLPAGLKAQQVARYQIIAAAKAEEMIESFIATSSSNPAIDSEGIMMFDVPVTYRSMAWDLESRLSSHRFGLMPLPMDIAKRLDSEDGEMQQIIANGGYLYYSQPMATSNLQEQGLTAAPPNEAQKLIIGIAGYPQQNALHSLPAKNFPYHTPWPSPPVHMGHMPDRFLPTRVYTANNTANSFWTYYNWPWRDMWREYPAQNLANSANDNEVFVVPWETSPVNNLPNPQLAALYHDDDIQKVFHWPEDTTKEAVGYFPYASGRNWKWIDGNASDRKYRPVQLQPGSKDEALEINYGKTLGKYPSRKSVLNYVASTLWYAKAKMLAPNLYNNANADPYGPFIGENPGSPNSDETNYWKEVQAMRFIAHAATCLTAWYSYQKQGDDTEDLSTGVKIPIITLAGQTSHDDSEFKITHDLIRYYHERSHYLINTFVTRYPYDWSVPRSLNRVNMMDFPLLQADLFSAPQPIDVPENDVYVHYWNGGSSNDDNRNFAKIFGRSETDYPQQWRPLAPEPIRNFGVGHTYQTHRINADQPHTGYGPYFGDQRNYNLTAPFLAAERCREIIMWAVDWQSYEDCETASSAPVDASKYPLAAPRGDWKGWGWRNQKNNTPYYPELNGDPQGTPQTNPFNGRMYDVEFRDEQIWAFRNPEKVIMFKNDVTGLPTGSNVESRMVLNDGGAPDRGSGMDNREIFNGMFGADRNYNRILDRGPVPKSVRMRAVLVARFNFYDPRIPAMLR